MENAPPLDPLGAEFVAIAFGIERSVPGFVDAYVGRPRRERRRWPMRPIRNRCWREPSGWRRAPRGSRCRKAGATI